MLQAPVIVAENIVTSTLPGFCAAELFSYNVRVTDCDPHPVSLLSMPPRTPFLVGVTKVTVTAVDAGYEYVPRQHSQLLSSTTSSRSSMRRKTS
jgi:hypothetical protein